MKKTILSILIAVASFGFANVTLPSPSPLDLNAKMPSLEPISKQGYYYLRFATSDADFIFANSICPGFGVGYRHLADDGAIDISMNGNGNFHFQKSCWTAPKVSYLHYLNPDEEKSAYVGGGLAWGGMDFGRGNHFIGIIPSATLGYEFSHKLPLLGFSELNISQPAIPLDYRGRFPGPIIELSSAEGSRERSSKS